MTDAIDEGPRILGTLRSIDGGGVVRIEDTVDAEVAQVWSALTDPARLADWLGDVTGDLRAGGTYRGLFRVSGWDGEGRIETCEAQRRLVVVEHQMDDPRESVTEIELRAEDGRTRLVVQQTGLPLEHVAAYGAGLQVHVEDLVAHVTGRTERATPARWNELHPGYLDQTVAPR